MQIDRQKLLAKIRALFAKTVDNGCTENEALSALDKAREMMDAYEVGPAELELKGEEAVVFASAAHDPNKVKRSLAMNIGDFCDCKVWQGADGRINFCGMTTDTELAGWLLDSLAGFVARELALYLIASGKAKGDRRRLINGFVLGCCGRIGKRLRELKEQSTAKATSNGRALVIVKDQLVRAKMKTLGLTLRTRRSSRRIDNNSYAAGQSAGDRASFRRPVGTGSVLALR